MCYSYKAIKLLEQPMKILERVLEKKIRCQVSIDNMQVPRKVVRLALSNPGVDEWLIRTVMALYTEACTVVKTDAGWTK